jgi:hypothetical protein
MSDGIYSLLALIVLTDGRIFPDSRDVYEDFELIDWLFSPIE